MTGIRFSQVLLPWFEEQPIKRTRVPRAAHRSPRGGCRTFDRIAEPPKPIDIVRRAYELWQENGKPEGKDQEFYYQAGKELNEQGDIAQEPPRVILPPNRSEHSRHLRFVIRMTEDMAEDISLHLAFVRAWGIYLMLHSDVNENDQRRSMFERRLRSVSRSVQVS